MFNFSDFNQIEVRNDNAEFSDGEVFVRRGKISFEIDLKCFYDVDINGEKMKVKYELRFDNAKYRPFGLSAELIDSTGNTKEEELVKNKFATISEAVYAMRMLARETVLPYTVENILSE